MQTQTIGKPVSFGGKFVVVRLPLPSTRSEPPGHAVVPTTQYAGARQSASCLVRIAAKARDGSPVRTARAKRWTLASSERCNFAHLAAGYLPNLRAAREHYDAAQEVMSLCTDKVHMRYPERRAKHLPGRRPHFALPEITLSAITRLPTRGNAMDCPLRFA